MSSNHVGFALLALGCTSLLLGARPAPARSARSPRRGPGASLLVVLRKDLPTLGYRRGERLAVLPDAPIRLGEVVALKSEPGRLVLARFHDELMHCVEGLVRPLDR